MNRKWLLVILPVLILACVTPPWMTQSINTSDTGTPTALKVVATATKTRLPVSKTPGEWKATVSRVHVNVRNKPNGNVVGTLLSGDTVTILECLEGWCRIKDPAGYVWQGCLSDNPNHLGCRSK